MKPSIILISLSMLLISCSSPKELSEQTNAVENIEISKLSECATPKQEPKVLNWDELRIDYPPESRRDGIQGTVVIEFTVGKEGEVLDRKVLLTPKEELSRSVLRDLRDIKFSPGICSGEPEVMTTTERIHFRM